MWTVSLVGEEIDILFDDFEYKMILNKQVGELKIIDIVMQESLLKNYN